MQFKDAVEFILKYEGGYVNNPQDPGGETKFGISKRSFPNVDIKNLTRKHAIALYEEHYWHRCKCQGLPEIFRLAVFDCAVNQGVIAAAKMFQAAIGAKVDGIIGPKTIDKSYDTNQEIAFMKFMRLRVSRYMLLDTFEIFGKGWMARLVDVSYHTKRA